MLQARNNSLMNKMFLCLCILTQVLTLGAANNAAPKFPNEDGSKLWLRYDFANTSVEITGASGTAMVELKSFWKGKPVELRRQRSLGHDDYVIWLLAPLYVIWRWTSYTDRRVTLACSGIKLTRRPCRFYPSSQRLRRRTLNRMPCQSVSAVVFSLQEQYGRV